ncbi:TPA: hypothetical protein DCX15_01095 [bacterium]|nr:hypothetical protein [bacterium]
MHKLKLTRLLLKTFFAYRSGLTRLDYLPYRIFIDVTSKCNLRCVMCPQSIEGLIKPGLMDFDLYKKVIDEIGSFANEVILHLSGEPLLHPCLLEMVRYGVRSGLTVSFNTNATVLTEEKSEKLIESGLARITFSFDGYTKEEYEQIKVGADFEKTLNKILMFLKLKKRLRSKRPYTVVRVVELKPHPSNLPDKDNFIRMLKSNGLNHLQIVPSHSFGGYFNELDRARGSSYTPCSFLWYSLGILWDGKCVPCCVDITGKLGLNNVKDSTISEIWNSDGIVKLREAMTREMVNFDPCRGCDMLWQDKVLGIRKRYLFEFLRESFLA